MCFQGGVGYNITIDMLILKTYSQKCLDFKYMNMIKGISNITL